MTLPSLLSGEAVELAAIAKRAAKTDDLNCMLTLALMYRLKVIEKTLLCHFLSESGVFYMLRKIQTKTQEVSLISVAGCSGIFTNNMVA